MSLPKKARKSGSAASLIKIPLRADMKITIKKPFQREAETSFEKDPISIARAERQREKRKIERTIAKMEL